MDRPLTQREIKKERQSKSEEPKTMVTNMTKRTIIIQVREKGSDFYIGERSIHVGPGRSFTDRTSVFNEDQLSNLKARGELRIIENVV